MIAKMLGFADLLSATTIIAAAHFPPVIVFFFAKYLLIKGGVFAIMGNVVSMIDVGIGLYMLFIAFGHSHIILSFLAIIFLFQKGLFSLVTF